MSWDNYSSVGSAGGAGGRTAWSGGHGEHEVTHRPPWRLLEPVCSACGGQWVPGADGAGVPSGRGPEGWNLRSLPPGMGRDGNSPLRW